MVSVTSADASCTKVEMVSLREPSFVSLLRSFKVILKSNVGPNGHLKLLVSGGGYVQLTSSSSQICQHYDQFDSPIIQFIIQIMKSQTDFGLYCGLVITSSLENMLSLQMNGIITPKQSIGVFNCLIKNLNNIFINNNLRIKLNFDSVSDFIPLVRSVLDSKCSTVLMSSSLTELYVQIIKAFLFTLDVDRMATGKIITRVFKGNEKFKFYPGVVYLLTDDDIWIYNVMEQRFKCKPVIKTLLFTTDLDNKNDTKGNDDGNSCRMTKIFEILEKAVSLGVDLIVCQKVVCNDVKLFLRRKSVIVLERLGTSLASGFERLTGSFPISNIDRLSADDVPSMTGVIDNISAFDFNNDSYLQMQCQSTSVGTLMLKTSCLAGTQQIKILVEQALSALHALVIDPYVCPGAGCFETCFFLHLQELCKEEMPDHDIRWLLNVLLEACGCCLPIWIDSSYYHAWTTEDQQKCNCQLISRNMVSSDCGDFHLISLHEPIDINYESVTEHCQPVKLTSDAIVDSLVHKRNSVIVSFESCVNLLNIGTVVYRKTF